MNDKNLTQAHHSQVYDNFLIHWKYLKREKVNGKWKYTYDLKDAIEGAKSKATNAVSSTISKIETAANNTKNKISDTVEKVKDNIEDAIDKTTNSVKETVKATPKAVTSAADKVVQKTTKVANDTGKKVVEKATDYYDKNVYETDNYNIDTKKEQIKLTEEWKKIVENEDPEYVKKNADGTKTYLLDEYLVKKKHPTIDIIDDIGSGRDISVNKLDVDALAAGAKDYVDTAVMMVGLVSYALMTKFKISQGSYKEEMKQAAATIERGAQYCSDLYTEVDVAYKDLKENAGKIPQNVDTKALEGIAMAVVTEAASEVLKEATKDAVRNTAKDVATEAGKEVVDYIRETRK